VIAAFSAVAVYVRPGHERADFVVMLAVLTVFTALSVLTWTGFGMGLRRLLQEPRHARIFNVSMGFLLVASIVPMVL
jgi:threonine/homoserine/homoserine lactone efflux protein